MQYDWGLLQVLSLVADIQQQRQEAARAVLRQDFAAQRDVIYSATVAAFSALQDDLTARNAKLPLHAPLATILACRKLRGASELRVCCERTWSSFGYAAAHLSSRSTGGEAGATFST